jgi:hypothetical protein
MILKGENKIVCKCGMLFTHSRDHIRPFFYDRLDFRTERRSVFVFVSLIDFTVVLIRRIESNYELRIAKTFFFQTIS